MARSRLESEVGKSSAMLELRVVPRAAKNQVVGLQADGRLKIRINAAPEAGKANQELVEFLAEILQVPLSSIRIISGKSSRNKRVLFEGGEIELVLQRLLQAAG